MYITCKIVLFTILIVNIVNIENIRPIGTYYIKYTKLK
jgi:hypothetical protein